VIMKLDILNAFVSLCTRLVLDVLSGKVACDYASGMKVDEDFETAVHELRAYFGFFKLAHTCESILRFYSCNGATNYLKLKTGGLQSDPEFMVFCIVTLHLWDRIFKMFPELRGLTYADDQTTIGRLSQVLKVTTVSKPVFKSDGNLDFNMGETMILARAPLFGMSMKDHNIFFRTTLTFSVLRMISLQRCSRYRASKCWGPL
jgi:hypothetical protein